MPKRPCTHRAEWRLLRGKPAQPLPAHYRLDCDYGTGLVAIFNEGEGDNPLYLCEQHAAAMPAQEGHSRRAGQDDVRLVEAEPVGRDVAMEIAAPQASAATRSPAAESLVAAGPTIEPAKPTQIDPVASPAALRPVAPPVSAAPAKAAAPAAKIPAAKVAAAKNASGKSAALKAAPAKSTAAKAAQAKAATPKSNSSSRGTARDLAYGNPAKALVDETIWNLAPGDYEAYKTALRAGKSPLEAAQAAGGQLAVAHRKIQEYAARLDALLSASQAVIRVDDTVRSVLDREILKIIGNDSMGEAEKDAAVAHLGEFQEWMNRELRREATPLEAHRVALAIAERASWGAASCRVSSELRPVYREVYRSLREAVRAAVPDAGELEERLANLYAAKSDLDSAPDNPISAPADLRIAASATASAPEQNFAEL